MTKKHYHKKALGQNFIEDEKLLTQLIALTGLSKEDKILEIGPGLGNLTKKLASKAKKVISIEVDEDLIPVLKLMEEEYPSFTLIHGDVLTIDFLNILTSFQDSSIKVIANIPYYITSEIIHLLLKHKEYFSQIYLMIQKEVAEKIMATSKKKGYGPLSILCQYYCSISIEKMVEASFFIPPPKVDSAFIKMNVKKPEEFPSQWIAHEATFLKVVKGAFLMRRKTLANNLQSSFSFSKERVRELLEKSNIKEKARGEECTMEDFMNLAIFIDQRK